MEEKRQHPRFPMESRIKIAHPSIGEVILTARDVSDGGAFLNTLGTTMPPVGSIITGQVQDVPADAPVLKMEIMRITNDGVGLRFVDE